MDIKVANLHLYKFSIWSPSIYLCGTLLGWQETLTVQRSVHWDFYYQLYNLPYCDKSCMRILMTIDTYWSSDPTYTRRKFCIFNQENYKYLKCIYRELYEPVFWIKNYTTDSINIYNNRKAILDLLKSISSYPLVKELVLIRVSKDMTLIQSIFVFDVQFSYILWGFVFMQSIFPRTFILNFNSFTYTCSKHILKYLFLASDFYKNLHSSPQ